MTDKKQTETKPAELGEEDLENAQGGLYSMAGSGSEVKRPKPGGGKVLTNNENILTTNENITE